jgi:hypothetical protein
MRKIYSVTLLAFLCTRLFAQDTLINFSHDAGFYSSPFNLTISSSIPSFSIVYTVDGSNPLTSTASFTKNSPTIITINPDDTTYRGRTPGFVVRAILKNGNNFVGFPKSKTYIFLNKVKDQKSPGKNWPVESYSSIKGHDIDYSMDSDVVYKGKYNNQIISSLTDIPTLSVSTDLKNLFDPTTGIYFNSSNSGLDWERECSFEIIGKDSTQLYQADAGLRIKGGWSRINMNPKYSLRLLFKGEYGTGKMKYPIFGTEGAATFNHIDLRTEQNCSWTLDGGNAKYNTFIRDAFSRDAQRDMGWPYMRSNYYHLYLNGMYWGLYTIQERVDNDYAKSYFDGDKDNYDIIKASEVTDGNQDYWKKLWTMTQQGFATDYNYYLLDGKNTYGKPMPGQPVLCDIDNLIDYMVLVFYTGNIDGPCSKWGNNKSGANFIALKDRSDKSFGFKFFALDFEYAMFVEPIYVAIGLQENRVNIGDLTTSDKMIISSVSAFNPQWLHYKLSKNKEYKARFMNRAYHLLREGGELTPEKNLQRFLIREKQVENAIIAESARWGDAKTDSGVVFTKDDWLAEIGSLKEVFIPQRTDIVIKQLADAGLFPNLMQPTITVNSELQSSEIFHLTDNADISIGNPSNEGSIYYTTNGSDPRGKEGLVNTSATKASAQTATLSTSNTMVICARIKKDDEWSPTRTIKILAPVEKEDYSSLKITELNYNPLKEVTKTDTTDGEDFEFIELKNTGNTTLNISGLRIDSAVKYISPENTIIGPQEYFVVASKPSKFFNRYGFVASGNYSGKLANSGEFILVEDSLHNEIFSFTYSDNDPWPTRADGAGYTLVSVEKNPTGNPQDASYWRLSENINGHPFFDTTYTYINTILGIQQPLASNFDVYPNPASDYLNISGSTSDLSESYVSMTDLYGRVVYAQSFSQQLRINLKSMNLTKGIYFVSVKSKEGVMVEKVMIK